MDWNGIFKTLGSTAIVVAAIVYIARQVLSHILSRDLQKYKCNLDATYQAEIERLKNDLRLKSFEHETKYAKLHEKHAFIIDELYKRLLCLEKATDKWSSDIYNEELLTVFENSLDSYSDFINENRIYLDSNSCALLDKFTNYNVVVFFCKMRQELPHDRPVLLPEQESINESLCELRKSIMDMKQSIEYLFRSIIGSNSN
ncbi:MAG: hypothetical protein ABFD83_02290 [Armatimonadota bacterium]